MSTIQICIPSIGNFNFEYTEDSSIADCKRFIVKQVKCPENVLILLHFALILNDDLLIKDLDL